MTELDAYERRLERAFARYVDGLPVEVDAARLTEEIAAAYARRRVGAWRIGAGGRTLTPGARRAAWVLVLVGLLAITAIGLALVGAMPHRELLPLQREPLPPLRGLVPTGIEVLQPDGIGYETTAVDGLGVVWAAGAGHVLRLDPSTGSVRTWTVQDDAAFGSAVLAAPARRGGAWLVSGRTARRFDGDGFREVVDMPFDVFALAEAPDGSLWATASGDRRGVYRRDGSAWTSIPGWDAGIEPTFIAVDGGGHAWVGAWTYPGPESAGLWRYDGSAWTSLPYDSVPARPRVGEAIAGVVEAIAATPDGSVWVVTQQLGGTEYSYRSLFRWDGSGWTEFGTSEIGFEATSLTVAADGTIWVADELMRAARFDGQSWRRFDAPDDRPALSLSGTPATVAAAPGATFLGTGSGIYRLADGRWERAWPPSSAGPARPAVMVANPLLAISAEEAWAGEWGGSGAWHYVGGRWVNASAGLPADAIVFDLARAPDGRVWAATEKGVAVFEGDRWTVVDDRWSRGLAFAPDGTAWVGGHADEGGLRTIREAAGEWAVTPVTADGLPRGTIVTHLTVGRDGAVWAAHGDWSTPPSPARFDGTAWQAVDPGPQATMFWVELVIVVAADGTVWAQLGGDTNAVARFDGATWTIYRAADGLPGDPGWLALGPDGQPWVSGSGGLARFDGERWVTVESEIALPWPERFSVAPDGTVWVTGPSMVGRIRTAAP
jgi:hypothetical protein